MQRVPNGLRGGNTTFLLLNYPVSLDIGGGGGREGNTAGMALARVRGTTDPSCGRLAGNEARSCQKFKQVLFWAESPVSSDGWQN